MADVTARQTPEHEWKPKLRLRSNTNSFAFRGHTAALVKAEDLAFPTLLSRKFEK
jgi:hypothetical protein